MDIYLCDVPGYTFVVRASDAMDAAEFAAQCARQYDVEVYPEDVHPRVLQPDGDTAALAMFADGP